MFRSRHTRRLGTSVVAACLALSLTASQSQAATLAPLATFGNADGWRAPFEVVTGDVAGTDSISPGLYNFLGNAATNTGVNGGNLERGFAFNPTTGHLILVSRNDAGGNAIRILDAASGADLGGLNQGTGVITGGTFVKNMVGVADDGAIYIANLSTNTASSPFNVYRWANETAEPTVAFTGTPGGVLSGARLGDSFDVFGSGANTKLVAGYGSSPNVAGNNSFAYFSTANGTAFTAQHISVAGAPPDAGDFRLGITFADADTVIGKQGTFARMVDVNVGAGTGTLTTSFDTDGQTLRPMDYAIVNGKPIIAVLEASAAQDELGRARIFIYDMTDPTKPLAERKLQEGTTLSPFTPGGPNQFANINGTGQVKFGPINGNVATIYAMSTNNGIEAFQLTLDPPPVLNADFNNDDLVDGADLLIWQRGLGISDGTALLANGDANSDGNVTAADLTIWTSQFGTPGGAAAAVGAVPEPASIGLAALAVLGIAGRRRKR